MEIWKDIQGYDGLYQVSNYGRIRSLKYNKERILKQGLNGKKYHFVNLSKNGIQKNARIHSLVAILFLDHKPNGMVTVIDHIDNNKSNNRVDNLQLISNRENCNKNRGLGKSKYVGVSWDKDCEKWRSQIYINKKQNHLGLFKTELEAHTVYQAKLKSLK